MGRSGTSIYNSLRQTCVLAQEKVRLKLGYLSAPGNVLDRPV